MCDIVNCNGNSMSCGSMKIYEMICLIKVKEFVMLKIRKEEKKIIRESRFDDIDTKGKMEFILFPFQNQLLIEKLEKRRAFTTI